MQPFTTLAGTAIPYLQDDINTDQITPVSKKMPLKPDYAALFFMNLRNRPDGSPDPDFIFNKPQFKGASILVASRNFGCGSSRESAVLAMLAVGIRCIVARSFADLYRENCIQNGLLPVVLAPADADVFEAEVVTLDGQGQIFVDLEAQSITCPSGKSYRFEIGAADRMRLLEGLDEIGLTMKSATAIAAWEAQAAPWLQQVREHKKLERTAS